MDSVEELNGTYFYKGVCNISASELFFWIFLDATDEQFGGLKDVVMMATMILGYRYLKPEQSQKRLQSAHL
jgi:chromosome condensin MukBEF MukE localization factor